MRKPLQVALVAGSLGLLTGCGPTFFSATGQIDSSGGEQNKWSATPVVCHRDVFDGDTSQIATFSFANPNADDPNREKNDRNRPAFLITANIVQDGAGYKVKLENSRGVATELNAGTCKTLRFESTEGFKGFAEMHPPIKGSLTLDCNAGGSHITSDVTFKHCD